MQYQFHIRKNRLVAAALFVGALLATGAMSAGVATLADSAIQQDTTALVVTATRLAPSSANGARVLQAAAGGAAKCGAIVC